MHQDVVHRYFTRAQVLGDQAQSVDFFEGRRTLVVHGPALWAHLEYGRSRLRICRGSSQDHRRPRPPPW